MASDHPLRLESGDLRICPERGEVRNARGESARLGPVNMKVLTLLVSRPRNVVTRRELFEAVWGTQTVSDDALTRCISDIRAQLGKLSDDGGHIETLPKRGYRWTADVRSVPETRDAPLESPVRERSAHAERPRWSMGRRALLALAVKGAAYASALVLIATLGVWLMDYLARPGAPVVAVLPIRADASMAGLAAAVERQLSEYLIDLDHVDLLSRSAIESRPDNPFPYFHYEFGARWLVESELRSVSGQTVLTVALVDARTGTVLLQSTESIASGGHAPAVAIEKVFEPLEDFIASR